MFLVPLLVTAAVGYWVLERAEHQKGRVREVGRIVAAVVLILSALGIACRLYHAATACQRMGKFGCPIMGKFGPPMSNNAGGPSTK